MQNPFSYRKVIGFYIYLLKVSHSFNIYSCKQTAEKHYPPSLLKLPSHFNSSLPCDPGRWLWVGGGLI